MGQILTVNYKHAQIIPADSPKKMAESTGKLPPTPTDHMVASAISVVPLVDAPAASMNIAARRSVMLNDILGIFKI